VLVDDAVRNEAADSEFLPSLIGHRRRLAFGDTPSVVGRATFAGPGQRTTSARNNF
jgi:hypothetical protein